MLISIPQAHCAARRVSAKDIGDPKARLYARAHSEFSANPIVGKVCNPQAGLSEQVKTNLVEYLKSLQGLITQTLIRAVAADAGRAVRRIVA